MALGRTHKLEGGQGGKRGHSNMSHWEYTEVIKAQTKKLRRNVSRKMERDALKEKTE